MDEKPEDVPPQPDVAEKPRSDVADRMLARGGAVELIATAIRAPTHRHDRGARELLSALMRDARARGRSKDDPVR